MWTLKLGILENVSQSSASSKKIETCPEHAVKQ